MSTSSLVFALSALVGATALVIIWAISLQCQVKNVSVVPMVVGALVTGALWVSTLDLAGRR